VDASTGADRALPGRRARRHHGSVARRTSDSRAGLDPARVRAAAAYCTAWWAPTLQDTCQAIVSALLYRLYYMNGYLFVPLRLNQCCAQNGQYAHLIWKVGQD
jgi:hypothetical protein